MKTVTLILAALYLSGWAWAAVGGSTGRPGEGTVSAGGEHCFEDCLGHVVCWERPPQRIISLSPNLTEILYAVQAGPAVVGVTRYCDYPIAAQSVTIIGGIVDPSLEMLVSLAPDLVLATRGVPLEAMASIQGLGLPVYALDSRGGLGTIRENILDVGRVTGRLEAANQLAATFDRRWNAVLDRTRGLSREDRPRVFYGDLDGAHWTAGPGTYIDDLIDAAGGRNVAGGAPPGWVPLALESIIAANPEVYLGAFDPERESPEEARMRVSEALRTLPGWPGTALGREAPPRLHLVDVNRLQRPGPRILDILEEFSRYLHPDLWADSATGEHGP